MAKKQYIYGFIEGDFGTGKTGFLAYIGLSFHKRYHKVYSNFKLDVPNGEYLDNLTGAKLLSLNRERKDCLMLLHESYNWFDKREWAKKENKRILDAIFQIRKLNIDIFCDIPLLRYMDGRSKMHSTHYYRALGEQKLINNGEIEGTGIYEYIKMMYDMRADMFFPIGLPFYLPLWKIYNKYDTFERQRQGQITLSDNFLFE